MTATFQPTDRVTIDLVDLDRLLAALEPAHCWHHGNNERGLAECYGRVGGWRDARAETVPLPHLMKVQRVCGRLARDGGEFADAFRQAAALAGEIAGSGLTK